MLQLQQTGKEDYLACQIETSSILSALIEGHAHRASNNEDKNNEEERCKQQKQDDISSMVIEINRKNVKRRLNIKDLKETAREEQMQEQEVVSQTGRRPQIGSRSGILPICQIQYLNLNIIIQRTNQQNTKLRVIFREF